MDCTELLKLLNDEVYRLFNSGVSEQDAFGLLSTDDRFALISHTSVQSLYKKFQKDRKKKQQNEERERMNYYRQNAKKSLLYKVSILDKGGCYMGIWQNRYVVTAKRKSNDTQTLNFHDLLHNISKRVSFQSTDYFCGIHSLDDNFILLDKSSFPSKSVCLAQVNFSDGSLQVIQELEHYRHLHLIVDSFNPSKFLLLCCSENGVNSSVVFKLIGEKIEVKSEVLLEDSVSFNEPDTYFDNQLLMFRVNGWAQNLSSATITIQDLDAKKQNKKLKLKPLPSNVFAHFDHSDLFQHKWSCNRLFISIRFFSTGEYGVAITDPQTCKWSILEFSIKLSIEKLLIVNKRDLLVCTRERRPESNDYLHKFYKLSMHKPESLRSKAWIKTIMLFKSKQAANPFEEARQYLPLNSDIRGIFAADQDDDE